MQQERSAAKLDGCEESEEKIRSLQQQVQSLQQTVQSKSSQLEEMSQIVAENQQSVSKKEQVILEKEQELQKTGEQLGRLEQQIDQLEREKNLLAEENRRLEGQIEENEEHLRGQFQQPSTQGVSPRPEDELQVLNESRMKLAWRVGEKVPRKIHFSYSAAANDRTLYLIADKLVGYYFSLDTASWCRLPNTPLYNCPAIFIDDILTLIGGLTPGDVVTNHLFSLKEGTNPKWTEIFSPMPTKRYGSTALFARASATVVVAGGRKSRGSSTTKVELLNTRTFQWSTAVDLPHPLSCAPAAVCRDRVYILGDSNMLTCLLNALIQPRRSFFHILFWRNVGVWEEASLPPVTGATCISIHGQLLAIGGKGRFGKPTTAVHLYDQTMDSWMIISRMGTPRSNCIAAVFPKNLLVVMGGCEHMKRNEDNDIVEIGTVEHVQ